LRKGFVVHTAYPINRAVTDKSSGARSLIEVDLREISLVAFPMLPQARVAAVKRAAKLSRLACETRHRA
jgi:phage head maturation protease